MGNCGVGNCCGFSLMSNEEYLRQHQENLNMSKQTYELIKLQQHSESIIKELERCKKDDHINSGDKENRKLEQKEFLARLDKFSPEQCN